MCEKGCPDMTRSMWFMCSMLIFAMLIAFTLKTRYKRLEAERLARDKRALND